ncbi:hypothetical protein TR51_28915 [Kitasatospora griseola]|uniref:Uncharacterized protein n=1 Tax=Kitasatospora griseola TaxID=2064 RepID=A0A0D0NUP2_KITGR|nr:hypothetical protein [Kitasatospora griseola]KIQ62911.1 hypothetical protein TR51_28915 [Kitasatospora griseola]
MSITANALIATVLFGPGIAGAAAYAYSIRGWREDSAALHTVLAISAAERAAALAEAEQDTPAPPDGGEPAPAPVVEPARLAAVIDFPTRRAA